MCVVMEVEETESAVKSKSGKKGRERLRKGGRVCTRMDGCQCTPCRVILRELTLLGVPREEESPVVRLPCLLLSCLHTMPEAETGRSLYIL